MVKNGAQIGVVNMVKNGAQIGVVNYNPNAWIPWMALFNYFEREPEKK